MSKETINSSRNAKGESIEDILENALAKTAPGSKHVPELIQWSLIKLKSFEIVYKPHIHIIYSHYIYMIHIYTYIMYIYTYIYTYTYIYMLYIFTYIYVPMHII